ncbi:arylsulfatase, partial [Flavobacteriaceae bacterium]|nr:arylsulfatase [Flavobacteriaceae bacterium]
EAMTRTAYRNQNWLLIPPYPGPKSNMNVGVELGNDSEYQLYNLDEDLPQQKNLAQSNPQKLKEMIEGYQLILTTD